MRDGLSLGNRITVNLEQHAAIVEGVAYGELHARKWISQFSASLFTG